MMKLYSVHTKCCSSELRIFYHISTEGVQPNISRHIAILMCYSLSKTTWDMGRTYLIWISCFCLSLNNDMHSHLKYNSPFLFMPSALNEVQLQWRHNEHGSVSNHRRIGCLFKLLFSCRPKKISKLRATGLCVRNPPVTVGFPSQRASNAENVSIWWSVHYIQWQEHGNEPTFTGIQVTTRSGNLQEIYVWNSQEHTE